MTKRAILFDLGGTLAAYYGRSDWPSVLDQCLGEVEHYLREMEYLHLTPETVRVNAQAENYEATDARVRPLEERLTRIFELADAELTPELLVGMCRRFLSPIFALARIYDDTLPVLTEVRRRGYLSAIVSNTPWGSPGHLWREHVAELGLDSLVDALVFCTDCGWRKPAKPVFERALALLGAGPEQALFVGDDPRWDTTGARACGIEAVWLNRRGSPGQMGVEPDLEVESLERLLELL